LQRRDVLLAKGKNSELIDRLLEDAEKWTQFRGVLRGQVDVARKFRTEYSDLNYEDEADDEALGELEKTIDGFAKNVSNRITQLDGASQSLIQIVSIWTIPKHQTCLYGQHRNCLWSRQSADTVIGI
jgi:hypothetical protein